MSRPSWAYWKWFSRPDSDEDFRLLRRKSDGATQLWEDGVWCDVPGLGLHHAISSGDLMVLEISAEDAELMTTRPGAQR